MKKENMILIKYGKEDLKQGILVYILIKSPNVFS
jgi:hypothetical protein